MGFQGRKAMVVSISFKELGAAAMTIGGAWLTCVVVRSVMIAEARRVFLDDQSLSNGSELFAESATSSLSV